MNSCWPWPPQSWNALRSWSWIKSYLPTDLDPPCFTSLWLVTYWRPNNTFAHSAGWRKWTSPLLPYFTETPLSRFSLTVSIPVSETLWQRKDINWAWGNHCHIFRTSILRCRCDSVSLIKASIHSHGLYLVMQSGQRYWSIGSKTTQLLNSFFSDSIQTAKPEREDCSWETVIDFYCMERWWQLHRVYIKDRGNMM